MDIYSLFFVYFTSSLNLWKQILNYCYLRWLSRLISGTAHNIWSTIVQQTNKPFRLLFWKSNHCFVHRRSGSSRCDFISLSLSETLFVTNKKWQEIGRSNVLMILQSIAKWEQTKSEEKWEEKNNIVCANVHMIQLLRQN